MVSKPMKMMWRLSNRADDNARPLADRHYNRQKIGSKGFVPPGRCLVLLTKRQDALWVTSWPFADYVKHRWAGAWVCSMFRNEGGILSSDLIRQAVAVTRWYYGEPPSRGMVTFVDTKKVINKPNFGQCYLRAGFVEDGYTKGGLLALILPPEAMPPARPAIGCLDIHQYQGFRGERHIQEVA